MEVVEGKWGAGWVECGGEVLAAAVVVGRGNQDFIHWFLIAFLKVTLPPWLLYGRFTIEVDEKLANKKFDDAVNLMASSNMARRLETDSSDTISVHFDVW